MKFVISMNREIKLLKLGQKKDKLEVTQKEKASYWREVI